MARTLKISGAAFSNVDTTSIWPSRAGLINEYVHGVDATQSKLNRANPASVLETIVGTVTYGAHHAVVKSGGVPGSHGINLGEGLPTNYDATIIHVLQIVSGCSTWLTSGGANNYEGFRNYNSVPRLYNTHGGANPAPAEYVAPAHGLFFVTAGSMPLNAPGRAHLWTGGTRATTTGAATGGRSRSASPVMAIGTSFGDGGSGVTNVAYTAVFKRILSDAELDAAYLSLKSFYTGKITIS